MEQFTIGLCKCDETIIVRDIIEELDDKLVEISGHEKKKKWRRPLWEICGDLWTTPVRSMNEKVPENSNQNILGKIQAAGEESGKQGLAIMKTNNGEMNDYLLMSLSNKEIYNLLISKGNKNY